MHFCHLFSVSILQEILMYNQRQTEIYTTPFNKSRNVLLLFGLEAQLFSRKQVNLLFSVLYFFFGIAFRERETNKFTGHDILFSRLKSHSEMEKNPPPTKIQSCMMQVQEIFCLLNVKCNVFLRN